MVNHHCHFYTVVQVHTFTFSAASLICSIVKMPKKSSSFIALITASATSSTLTGGARSRSEAGRELNGFVKFSVARSILSRGSPITSNGISKPSTLLFPYMNPGLNTTPVQVHLGEEKKKRLDRGNKKREVDSLFLKISYHFVFYFKPAFQTFFYNVFYHKNLNLLFKLWV